MSMRTSFGAVGVAQFYDGVDDEADREDRRIPAGLRRSGGERVPETAERCASHGGDALNGEGEFFNGAGKDLYVYLQDYRPE